MKYKISFINAGILANDFRRFWWIGAGYLLGMFLSVPLNLIMLHSRYQGLSLHNQMDSLTGFSNVYLRIFQFNSPFQVMLLILVPIAAGLWLFHYIQSHQACDMAHTLPVKREIQYNTHVLAGIIFLWVPLIITALISWIVTAELHLADVTAMNVLVWLLLSMLLNLLFFMTSVAVAMFTGISVLQGVMSLILLLLPTGLFMLLTDNFRMYTYGFAYDYYIHNVQYYSPLLRFSSISFRPIQAGEIIIYLIASIILYISGRSLYRRRQLENAGSAIVFPVIRPFFKYSTVFCCMLLLGSYYYSTQNQSMTWTYFGYFLGSLLAYVIVEILLHKSLRIFQFRIFRGYAVFVLVIVVLFAGLHLDVSGFEKRLPDLAEVDNVYFDNSFNRLINLNNNVYMENSAHLEQYATRQLPPPVYSDHGNMAGIYALHQAIINNIATDKADGITWHNNPQAVTLSLAYELKNGSRLVRQYRIIPSQYTARLKPVYESWEYKKLHNAIADVDPATVKMIGINALQVNKSLQIVDPRQIQQAVGALQSDILNQSYEDIIDTRPGWAHITILLNDNTMAQMNWDKSYANFSRWLTQQDKYDQARIIPADIKYALVERTDENNNKAQLNSPIVDKYETTYDLAELEKKTGVIKITGKDNLEICLQVYHEENRQPFRIVFFLNNGGSFSGGFSADTVPAFIKTAF